MSAKKQTNRWEAVRNAATGYAAVVLGIVCFLLVLAILLAGVRTLNVLIPSPTTTTTTTTTTITGAGTA